jgi:hypothetical protein
MEVAKRSCPHLLKIVAAVYDRRPPLIKHRDNESHWAHYPPIPTRCPSADSIANPRDPRYQLAMQTTKKRAWSKPTLKDLAIFMEVTQYAASR